MNAFTEMRRRYLQSDPAESFAEYYLAHRCYVSDADDVARNQLRSKLASLRTLSQQDSLKEADFLRLLSELGENVYLDRSIVALIIQHKGQITSGVLDTMRTMLAVPSNATLRYLHLLDLCIECDLPLLSEETLRAAIAAHRQDYDVFSTLLEYVLHFSIDNLAVLLLDYLSEDLPENIQFQLIDILLSNAPIPSDLQQTIQQKLASCPQRKLYLAYQNRHREKMSLEECGIVVLQPMFYGDPEDSGKGKSGGLGTLLKTLGNQLSKQQQIAQVFTLTLNQDWSDQKPFLKQYEAGHWLVRLPVYLNADDPHAFVKRELSIKRAVQRFLQTQQIEPDLFHVRYLDNASKAMALLAKELHAKLVFTLTPDPHRNMVDAEGDILCFKVEETLEKLNKITIGDELLALTDGIVGIGGDSVKQELELYFPQLKPTQDASQIRMIGEGIDTQIDTQNFDVWRFLSERSLRYRIRKEEQSRPVILNVGRLNWQKGQHHLLQAWGESRLWQDFNLILIGGNRESKDAQEQAITASFDKFLAVNPHLLGRFAHVEALPNEDIRRIERKLMEHEADSFPNLYVCSSVKEEFGISILEAMSEGFLAFVPVKGGAKTYLDDGVNGFLVDTANASTLKNDLERVLYHAQRQRADYTKIQHAGKRTVLDQFSIEEIAKRFLELYLGLHESGELLCFANQTFQDF